MDALNVRVKIKGNVLDFRFSQLDDIGQVKEALEKVKIVNIVS
jgi:hypothetical protein